MKCVGRLVFLGLLPLLSVPAHAGTWTLGSEFDGIHKPPGQPNAQWEEYSAVVDGPGSEVSGHAQVYPDPGHTETVSLEGWCRVVAKWHPANANDLPPQHVSFLASPIIGGNWTEDIVPEQNATLTLDGVAGAATDTSFNVRGHHYKGYEKRGPYLMQMDTTTMEVDPEDGLPTLKMPKWNVKVALTLVNQTQHTPEGEVAFYYNAQMDNRSVRLSRAGAPTALPEKVRVNGTSVDNPALNKNRDEWVEADGTGHGHTLASYKERVLFAPMNPLDTGQMSDDDRDVLQTFNVTRSVSWSPPANLTYQWSPASIGANNINSAIQQMPRSNAVNNPEGIGATPGTVPYQTGVSPKGWLNTPAANGQEFTVSYDLTDQRDGATAKAKYYLKLHDEWENGTPDNRYPSGKSYEEQYFVPAGAVAVTKSTTATWKITQTNDFDVELKAFFKGDFKLGDWGSAGGSVEASHRMNLQTVIGTQAGTPSTIPAYTAYGPTVRYLSVVVYQATRVHKLFDHYGINGYLPDSSTTNYYGPPALPAGDVGKTPQSKIESIGQPRADWWPFNVGGAVPAEGSTGTYYPSGGVS